MLWLLNYLWNCVVYSLVLGRAASTGVMGGVPDLLTGGGPRGLLARGDRAHGGAGWRCQVSSPCTAAYLWHAVGTSSPPRLSTCTHLLMAQTSSGSQLPSWNQACYTHSIEPWD